jgi:4-amino-4-deoxy-L-arabinose transferase-like glycosyltransferase
MKRFIAYLNLPVRPWVWITALVLVLAAGFAVRMVDLTDLPLDFHPTRQLFSALKARAMYYETLPDAPDWQREIARSTGDLPTIEPPVMEFIVAQTWRLTGEYLWIARIYSSLFWVLGGLALFLLARDLAGTAAAFISTLIYLFVPYGIIASRAFQPDPLMVALIIYSLWSLFRWQNTGKWKWALWFGIFSGLALFVKNLSVFIVVGAFAGVLLGNLGVKRTIRSLQVWAMAVLLVLPVGVYTLWGVLSGALEGQFSLRFFPALWDDPSFYFSWQSLMSYATGFGVWFGGLVGIFLAERRRERPILLGMWAGYILFGFVFSYHFTTHDYYHLPFIPIAVLSLAPLVKTVLEKFVERNPGILLRLALAGLVIAGAAVQSYYGIARLTRDSYGHEVAYWQEIGDVLGHDANVIALTHDYGYRLAYWGWQNSKAWFTTGDFQVRYLAGQEIDIAEMFEKDTQNKDFFLVTLFGDFEAQEEIRAYLYENYPIISDSDEYIIFDLRDR